MSGLLSNLANWRPQQPSDLLPVQHDAAWWARDAAKIEEILGDVESFYRVRADKERSDEIARDFCQAYPEQVKAETSRVYLAGPERGPTRKRYLAAFTRFRQFCIKNDLCPLPASDPVIAFFLLHEFVTKQCTVSWLNHCYQGIAYRHRLDGCPVAADDTYIRVVFSIARQFKKDALDQAIEIVAKRTAANGKSPPEEGNNLNGEEN
jgi:hypothetical protein